MVLAVQLLRDGFSGTQTKTEVIVNRIVKISSALATLRKMS